MVGETADIVMAFYKCGIAHAGFYAVGVNRTLNKIVNLADLFGFGFKHADKFSADYLALLLGIADSAELTQKLLRCID